MNLKDDFHDWNKRKKLAKQKMVDCPWANFSHKTWPGEICMRCNKKVDENGNPDRSPIFTDSVAGEKCRE